MPMDQQKLIFVNNCFVMVLGYQIFFCWCVL